MRLSSHRLLLALSKRLLSDRWRTEQSEQTSERCCSQSCLVSHENAPRTGKRLCLIGVADPSGRYDRPPTWARRTRWPVATFNSLSAMGAEVTAASEHEQRPSLLFSQSGHEKNIQA